MSHFVTIPYTDNQGVGQIQVANTNSIDCAYIEVGNSGHDTVRLVIVDPAAPKEDNVYFRVVRHAADARRILVENMAFDAKVFDQLNFEHKGSLMDDMNKVGY